MRATTDRYKTLHELNPSQSLALEVLDGGGTHAKAATAAGVDRTTVSRWVTKHPAFVAELNRRKRERAEEASRISRDITLGSLELIQAAIEEGDLKTANQWLAKFGLLALDFAEDDPITSDEVIEERRERLRSPHDPQELLDSLAERTTERATMEISEDLDLIV